MLDARVFRGGPRRRNFRSRQRSGQLDARASRAKPLRATRPESTLHGVGGTEIDNGAEVPDGREWYTFKRGETITSLLEQTGLDRVTLQKLNPHVNLSNMFPGDRIVIKGTANLRPNNHSTVAVVGSSAPQVVSSSTRTLVNLGSPLMLVLVCALTGASLVGKKNILLQSSLVSNIALAHSWPITMMKLKN